MGCAIADMRHSLIVSWIATRVSISNHTNKIFWLHEVRNFKASTIQCESIKNEVHFCRRFEFPLSSKIDVHYFSSVTILNAFPSIIIGIDFD